MNVDDTVDDDDEPINDDALPVGETHLVTSREQPIIDVMVTGDGQLETLFVHRALTVSRVSEIDCLLLHSVLYVMSISMSEGIVNSKPSIDCSDFDNDPKDDTHPMNELLDDSPWVVDLGSFLNSHSTYLSVHCMSWANLLPSRIMSLLYVG